MTNISDDGHDFYVTIEDSSGNAQGSGPLTSVESWESTARMDRIGQFRFRCATTDPQADEIQKKRIARAYGLINGSWQEVGAGVIDSIVRTHAGNGIWALDVSGLGLERELSYRSVRQLSIGEGSGATHSSALNDIDDYAPAGWTITPAGSPVNDYIYARFAGESVLGALLMVADMTQTHFYRGSGREIIFDHQFTDSGVRAIQAGADDTDPTVDDWDSDVCAVAVLDVTTDTHDLLTRIIPYGSGNGEARLTLAGTSRSAPTGYVLDKSNNYIEHTDSVNTYGVIDHPEIQFSEITSISNTDSDVQAAANMLFDVALEELKRRSTELVQSTISLSVYNCPVVLRPLQTIHVNIFDPDADLDIDSDWNILEATLRYDAGQPGLRTTGLVVSNADRWPESDASATAQALAQGQVYEAHPQRSANAPTIAYTKLLDGDNNATFRFRFGAEVVILQQVLFEFQILQFESSVINIVPEVTTSSSGGGSVESASSGGDHTHTVTIPSHQHSITIPGHSHTVTIPGHSHTVTVNAHDHTVTIPAHSHSVTIPGHDHTVTIPSHDHSIAIYDSSGAGQPSHSDLFFDRSNELFVIYVSGTDSPDFTGTTQSNSSTQESSSTQSSTQNSSDELAQQTQSSSTLPQQTPSSSELAQQTPSSSEVSSNQVSSDSGGGTQDTSANAGSHTHTVTVPSHTHTVVPALRTAYGIFRADDVNTYGRFGISNLELEYRINGGSWADLGNDVTDAGDGWYALDVTDTVMDTNTFRPLQTSNTIEFRADSLSETGRSITVNSESIEFTSISTPFADVWATNMRIRVSNSTNVDGDYIVTSIDAGTSKVTAIPVDGSTFTPGADNGDITQILTAMIDAQLSVRNIIQAIAYD